MDESTQHARRCPRCDTPAQPGGTVCERCELPFEGPAKVRYNPAGLALPSPVQGHATVLAAVLSLNFWNKSDFGELNASDTVRVVVPAVVGFTLGAQVCLNSFFLSSRKGRSRCRVTGVAPNGQLVASDVALSPTVGARASVEFDVAAATLVDSHDVEARCS